MSMLTPELGLLFWMTLSFGIVLLILVKFGFPVILKSVEERKNYIDESLLAAKEAHEELAKVKMSGEALLEKARREQTHLLKETTKLGEKMLAEARLEAQKESDKLIAAAREQIRTEKEEALRQIRGEVSLLSLNLAEKILRETLKSEEEQMQMIDRLLDEIEITKS